MPAILTDIVKNKREEISARKAKTELGLIQNSVTMGDGSFVQALTGTSVKLICEIKPKSPSAGVLSASPDISKILSAYDEFAAAISVLTDEKFFGGTLDLLEEISSRSSVPTLCKDFIIDPYQCFEARRAGAQAVLLIVKILDDAALSTLHKTIVSLGMTAVVEVQSKSELERGLALQPEVILINNRNLETFTIDFQTTRDLAPEIPPDVITISASGIAERSEIEALIPYCTNFLVGSSLMVADDLRQKLQNLSSGVNER